MIKGLHSVLIHTENIKEMAPFYRDIIGLKPEMEGEDFAVFEAGAVRLALGVHSEISGRAKDPDRVLVDFEVDNCRAEYERLKAGGVGFSREPSQDEGFIVATFLDPDGNMLQLFQATG